MRPEPQAGEYRPDPALAKLADWLASPVEPADFPETTLRFRNDRWAAAVGLARLSQDDWLRHFGRFAPLPGNLAQPLALKYHGHQFRTYNPEIGDGRGFLFAQMRGGDGRLLDLGTKGSGTTPYSRGGDGRLTLKGAVREILATEMLEALGCNTSKTFSVVETGEQLTRGDEPSPTRSAVMVRLSHGHIRIGTFQRLLVLEEAENMAALVDYCLGAFPGPAAGDVPDTAEPAVRLMHQVVQRMADLAASYTVAGFVHGVLNTDNMNISGESFDYGPWRWLPRWDAGFTAAYFDHAGLYAFGRQAEAIHWNCAQLAIALRLLSDAKPLIAALERFGDLYTQAAGRRWAWRMGLQSGGPQRDAALVAASERHMIDSGIGPDVFFNDYRSTLETGGELDDITASYQIREDFTAPSQNISCHLQIQEVEALWSPIDERDDWRPLMQKITDIRALGQRLGPAPVPMGHEELA